MRPAEIFRRYPGRSMLATLSILTALYAGLFQQFMSVFENRHVSLFDAVFWTISHLTTTGEATGQFAFSALPIKVLAIVSEITGLLFFLAAFPVVFLPQMERRFRQPLPIAVDRRLADHIVICGYNPLVESLTDELAAGDRRFVVVSEDQKIVKGLVEAGIPSILGSPDMESVLINAGVERSAVVIANLEDAENANVVLTAAALGAREIIALIDDIANAKYYEYAGASQVFSPKELLGTYLARKATTSLKDELFGENEILSGLDVVELPIYPESPIDGISLADIDVRGRTGASIVGIWHRGQLELEPGPNSVISAENVLMAVGTRQQLLELQKITRTDDYRAEISKRHFVVAGFGDVGRRVADELIIQGISFKIIDSAERPGEYLRGDATSEKTLKEARIEEASTYIVAGHLDQDNIFSTLLARKLNPNLHILARANHQRSVDKLYRAGADFVFSLATVAGQMLARIIQGDKVVTLAEGLKVLTAEVGGKLTGRTIGSLRVRTLTGCTVIALRDNSRLLANPGPDTLLVSGATIVILGSRNQVAEFKRRFKTDKI